MLFENMVILIKLKMEIVDDKLYFLGADCFFSVSFLYD